MVSPNLGFEIRRTCGAVEAGVVLSIVGGNYGVVIISSSTPGRNGAAAATGLTISVTRTSRHILLVSNSLEGPGVRRCFSVPDTPKLAGCLDTSMGDHATRRTSLFKVVRPARCPGLSIVASNSVPPGPDRVLNDRPVVRFLGGISRGCSCVVVSAPPVGIISSTLPVVHRSSKIILIIHSCSSARPRLRGTLGSLGFVSTGVLNFIIGCRHNRSDNCNSGCDSGCKCSGCNCNSCACWGTRNGHQTWEGFSFL